jgi:tetratricopeptide (TPR) repeat protein
VANVSKWFGFGKSEDYDRGLRSFESEDYPSAIEFLERAVKAIADPSLMRQAEFFLAESYAKYGLSLLRSDQPEAAIKNLERAVEFNPGFPDLHLHLSLAYRRLGMADFQRAALDRALEINPHYAAAILHRGLARFQSGDFEDGLADIQKAVESDPSLNRSRYEFALECYQRGDTSRTIAALESLGADEHDDANFHARIADSFAKKQLYDEAIAEYEKAIAMAPDYADLRCRLGNVLLDVDRPLEALEQFEVARRINRRYVDAIVGTGIANRRLGRLHEARSCFQAVIEIDPHHIVAQVELGRAATR